MSEISFNFEELKFTGIRLSQAEFWQRVYPDIDITDLIMNKIPCWLDANPDRARKYKKWKSFLVNWFSRDQWKIDILKGGMNGNLFYQKGRPYGKTDKVEEK
jgi:hypothetical protein